MRPFVAVHLGAGRHHERNDERNKGLVSRVVRKAIEMLEGGASALDTVQAAVRELEDDPSTNAGIGSNLNEIGQVECDASIMDGQTGLFGCVGAVQDVKNPVDLARAIIDDQVTTSPFPSPVYPISVFLFIGSLQEMEPNPLPRAKDYKFWEITK